MSDQLNGKIVTPVEDNCGVALIGGEDKDIRTGVQGAKGSSFRGAEDWLLWVEDLWLHFIDDIFLLWPQLPHSIP